MVYYTTMKKQYSATICALCAFFCAGAVTGCNSTPAREQEPAVFPVSQAQKKVIERRAAALKKVTASLKIRGVGIRLNAYRNTPMPDSQIISLVKKLGFNRIYCYISSETELSEELERLVVSAASAGIPVELAVRQGDFKKRYRGNVLVRFFLPQFRQLPDLAEDIVAFNEDLPEKAKLAGVTVRFEPHLFTYANGAAEIPGLHYIWSNYTFGKGLDNDKLVELSIKQLQQMKKKLGALPLSVELPDFYPLWKKEGKISQGSVKDFAQVGKVMLQCSGNVPSMLLKGAAFMKEGKDILAVIPVADHTSVRSGALRRRDWNDLVKSLGYFINSSRNMNCSGVVIRPLSEVGYMLLEQD